ncbi:MAG: pyrroline-5-carboxylate reductase [Desulfitobacteriaceae bacterium]|nr:pyrroline-5-carboxylate reductase [Desulfitobacteriaceae bacterium]MDI6879612.1 pyrroline-5-carboxylate reductase [Desulfitobacteriaceae bacterium]MDI6915394.1 pyrroline-5-carboxylate reductase [Desulfitobacteriaceae bacterium]
MKNIGFIGGGNIAEAIIYGLRQAGGQQHIRVVNRSNAERLQRLVETYEVIPESLPGLLTASEVVVIAVKPKDVGGVLEMLKAYDLKNKLVISVAAGIPLALLEKHLPGIAVIRAMPNTSSAVLHSVTGLVQGNDVTLEHVRMAEQIFKAVGHILWIPESQMNALMSVSGSGPAYFYLFTECLVQAGVEMGLQEADAEMLARETLIGVGKMMAESGKSPGRLREEVTSPNGTTIEALQVFWEGNLKGIVQEAANACAQRGVEMEGEYSV